ncbi:MAG: CpsD/CapB family tyrosine-protein kinase [Alphaproteobacteria bacterium]|nr:CpsD/CapB family tyrosine-protein kinase [Alphaproteobacteria bacterium]
MDKLEKALLKARQDRQGHESRHVAVQAEYAQDVTDSLPGPSVRISDAFCEQNRIIAALAKNPHADLFRILRTQVLQTMRKNEFKTLAVTSPNYDEGKTTIAINLAMSIALDLNQTVLLVDLDLRHPSVHSYLGLQPRAGIADYLSGKASIADCMERLPLNRMTILPSGASVEHSSEVLGSPQMANLACELRERYPDRLVIYDMPPLLVQDDPLTFLPHIDGVLLVAREGKTPVADVSRSLEILSATTVIGTVLNDHRDLFAKEEWLSFLDEPLS